MSVHPSLSAQLKLPPPLVPMRKMGPNEPCWCKSGKKWKKCHKDREYQPEGHIGERMAAIRAEMVRKGYCSHPEAGDETCGDRIIRAHTIQRKGGLAAIAENGHVISVKTGFDDIFKNDGIIIPRTLGVRDASTFMGFCDRHDDQMFKPIETNAPVLSEETAFLLAFRAVAYELFTKQSALRCLPIQREMDKGKPFEFQCIIQEYLYLHEQGLLRGLKDMFEWKSDYDIAFINKRFDSFRFYGVAFSEVLPVVGCGAFFPEFDFTGQPLQRISRGNARFDHITYNITVLDDVSVAVFGWSQEKDGPAAQFVKSFAALLSSEKADAAVRLAFEHIENIYMNPSWWKELHEMTRNDAIQRMISGLGLGGVVRQSDCLRNTHIKYISSNITQEIGSS